MYVKREYALAYSLFIQLNKELYERSILIMGAALYAVMMFGQNQEQRIKEPEKITFKSIIGSFKLK